VLSAFRARRAAAALHRQIRAAAIKQSFVPRVGSCESPSPPPRSSPTINTTYLSSVLVQTDIPETAPCTCRCANGVGLCFVRGASLPDRAKALLGAGKQTRFVRLPSVDVLNQQWRRDRKDGTGRAIHVGKSARTLSSERVCWLRR
jgi:hypothetical protein